ncbi:Regulator of nuclear mRNA [Handroanthus impetiginosus]|uniref:Regulator of nuclear mRNA n=1 Tax=Handroanthus impetiginosus TaxID=429701 RepID=A0A2G9HTB2_9LAMI|nr:Regulator of nuclear mRNA [Handroanthus impetiginosus]
MGSAFNPQILVGKLAKLNNSQQSIETLSHWCIFHMNKATQVVETWARQFHCAPRDQRLAFLYLANDIIQNSRRKGAEFVAEFWKVLPDSLRDVIENGNESERNAALRLISIWEERKVFGSRGQILKEEFVKRPLDVGNRNSKHAGFKVRPPGGNALDKLMSGYQAVYGSQLDEEAIFDKCRNAVNFVEKVDKDIEGHIDGRTKDELKGQHAVLVDCIQQLTVVESSRENLLSILREAVREQEYKLDQVRNQLQAAQSHSEQADSICRQLFGGNGNENENESPVSQAPQNFIPGTGEQTTSVIYTRQIPFAEKSDHIEEDPKSAAAAVAAKLAASTSSAQMLTYVLSSLASEGVINNPIKDAPNDYPSEKRARIENDHPSYVPSQVPQSNLSITSQELTPSEPPPPPSSPPPLPPLPPPLQPYQVPQYMQTAMPISSGPYGYSMNQQPPVPFQGYVPVGPPANAVSAFVPPSNGYQSYPTEASLYGQPSSLPMAPMGRQ